MIKRSLMLILLFCITPALCADNLVIALSPYHSAQQATAQAKNILMFLTTLEPGSQIRLMDGYHVQTIGTFTVPTGTRYASPKARIKANRSSVAALMRFAKSATLHQHMTAGALRMPQLLRQIGEQQVGEATVDVLLLGAPFYDDSTESQYSMAGGYVPSDGHIKASRAKTPYGTADHPDLLQHMRIHMGFGEKNRMMNDRHRFYVQRFWTLWIESQKGQLVTFSADLNAVLERIRHAAAPMTHHYRLGKETTIEMIRLRPENVTISLYDQPVSDKPLPNHLIKTAAHVQIGLAWACEMCDLDLYARPWPDAEVLFFNHSHSDQGSHWKDYRHAPSDQLTYETIEFTVPVDLRKLFIAVNFYDGQTDKPVTGEIRMAVDGLVFAQSFQMHAQHGNGGQDVRQVLQTGRADSPYTQLIDPLHLAGLR